MLSESWKSIWSLLSTEVYLILERCYSYEEICKKSKFFSSIDCFKSEFVCIHADRVLFHSSYITHSQIFWIFVNTLIWHLSLNVVIKQIILPHLTLSPYIPLSQSSYALKVVCCVLPRSWMINTPQKCSYPSKRQNTGKPHTQQNFVNLIMAG